MADRADFAAHQGDKFARDRETQPGSAVAPRCRSIGLYEGVEQFRQRLRVDSDAGVFHLEPNFRPCFGGVDAFDPQNHSSLGREFDGVGQQVQQDLSQPHGIADQRVRQIVINLDRKVQHPLFALHRHDLGQILDGVAKAKRRALQLQRGGAELGEVQHVIDDVQQRLAGDLDARDEPLLLRGQFCARQQIGQADDSIERRPDFVAHIGDEHALGAAGALRLLSRLAQGFLALPVGFFIKRAPLGLRVALGLFDLRAPQHTIDGRSQFLRVERRLRQIIGDALMNRVDDQALRLVHCHENDRADLRTMTPDFRDQLQAEIALQLIVKQHTVKRRPGQVRLRLGDRIRFMNIERTPIFGEHSDQGFAIHVIVVDEKNAKDSVHVIPTFQFANTSIWQPDRFGVLFQEFSQL
ncbi:hypothetical protein M2322_004318 [Rhodoblastus acidophilus]|nr:hypothetical protein [Rhodoblastus acidophilus]